MISVVDLTEPIITWEIGQGMPFREYIDYVN